MRFFATSLCTISISNLHDLLSPEPSESPGGVVVVGLSWKSREKKMVRLNAKRKENDSPFV